MRENGPRCSRGRLRAFASVLACGRGRCKSSGEAQMVAQIRQALGADRFDEDFAAGVRLNRQQAIASVRGPRGTGTAAS